MNIKSANILIVDDQILNVKLLEKILKQAGYNNIFSTTDSRQTVLLFHQHQIDIVLLDIRMPQMDGFEVMTALQGSLPVEDYLPVLVLTAELTSEVRAKALDYGAKDFLTKPFNQLEVLQRIANILQVRLLYKRVRQQNHTLEEEVRKRTQELEDSRYEVIARLGRAAEFRDNETGNHIIRMSEYCRLLARQAGLSDQQTELIYLAAPMHDIGKIGIPDAILLKPGKFTEEEWLIMQSHVEVGAEILSGSDIPLMQVAKNIALTHHEKWDGSGYPNGLAGKEIPLEGRICAICDVFDALTSERPYKKAWPIDKAVALIHEQSGKHFDPELTHLFDEILEPVHQFRMKHIDSFPEEMLEA